MNYHAAPAASTAHAPAHVSNLKFATPCRAKPPLFRQHLSPRARP